MSAQSRRIRQALALASFGAAACSTDRSTSPGSEGSFDAQRVRGEVAAVESVSRAPILTSFVLLSERFDLRPAASAAVSSASEIMGAPNQPTLAGSKRLALSTADRLMTAAVSHSALASPVLRPESLGRTFVYDPAVGRYVLAEDRTGAPANGVRFILYAVNPITHEPVVTAEIGHADLLDEGANRPAGIGLRLIVVSGTTTYLDYSVDLAGTDRSGTLAVAGFMTDGITRLNFRINAAGTAGPGGGSLDVEFHFEVPGRAFAVAGRVHGTQALAGSVGRVDLQVRSGPTRIDLAVTGDEHTVNATILVNGVIFATVTGDPRAPTVRGAGGRELRPDELEALHGIMRLAGGVFQMFENLLKPVAVVFALSTVP